MVRISSKSGPRSSLRGPLDFRSRGLGRHGNRQLNAAIHRIAVVQISKNGLSKTYYQRRLAEGDSPQRALRSLKHRLARAVFAWLPGRAPASDGPSKTCSTLPRNAMGVAANTEVTVG